MGFNSGFKGLIHLWPHLNLTLQWIKGYNQCTSRQAVIPASYNVQELFVQFLAQKLPEREASGTLAVLYTRSPAGFLPERCRELHYRMKNVLLTLCCHLLLMRCRPLWTRVEILQSNIVNSCWVRTLIITVIMQMDTSNMAQKISTNYITTKK